MREVSGRTGKGDGGILALSVSFAANIVEETPRRLCGSPVEENVILRVWSEFYGSNQIILYCLITSLIWGATNPLIKKTTKGINTVRESSFIRKIFYEIKYLLLNWKYVLLFLINQGGSLLYFILLQSADLSLVVPLTNALTLIVTGICGVLLGEEKPNIRMFLGTCIISVGIFLCILDKIQVKNTEAPV